jgi:NADPH:quinone reductase-like Zn-dependent oxidoreductase
MRALALTDFDHPPQVIEVEVPSPAAGEVLVRVGAASVNAYDTLMARGAMKDYLPYEFPAVIGQDVAGEVEAVGEGVDAFQAGDRVFGTMGMKQAVHDGSFGEFATPQAAALAKTPFGVDDEQAGSLGVAATTALSGDEAIDPAPGAVVLVVGATGGVGSFVVQLAAARGARVIASVRPGDEGFVAGLGAADTVDYTGDLPAAVAERHPDGVDGVIDVVNRDPASFATLVRLVREGGRAASAVGGAGDATEVGGVGVFNVGGNPALLGRLADMVAQGSLSAAIQRSYPLADSARALEDFAAQHTLGKRVISVG